LLPTIGKWPAISAAERRAGIAQCHLSKLTGKLIEEEQQLSAAVTIGGKSYEATIDTGATASFVSEELADNIAALVEEPERGAPAAGGTRAKRYRSQPSHTPAVLIPREQIPLLPFEPLCFLTDLRAITSYKFGGTNTQSSELDARIS